VAGDRRNTGSHCSNRAVIGHSPCYFRAENRTGTKFRRPVRAHVQRKLTEEERGRDKWIHIHSTEIHSSERKAYIKYPNAGMEETGIREW